MLKIFRSKFFFLFYFTFISFHLIDNAYAKTIWIAMDEKGNDNGQDRNNAHSIDWFNSVENWEKDSIDILPGDTVILTGIFSKSATIQGSGRDKKNILILFDGSAVFRSSAWGPSGVIYANGKSNFIIDGGNKGSAIEFGETWQTSIEATANGQLLANKLENPRFIYILNARNVILKRLKITNGYVRDSASTDSRDGGTGILLSGSGNLEIRNNFVRHFENGIYLKGTGTNAEGLIVDSNYISYVSNGILFACASAGNTILGGYVTHNRINHLSFWTGGPHHNDGIQTITSQSGNKITGLHVAYNYIGPDAGKDGDSNAWIFLEDNVNHCYVYNNLLVVNDGDWLSNGCIAAGRNNSSWSPTDTNGLIYNNTIHCGGKNIGITASHMDVVGNIVYNVSTFLATYSSMKQTIDYNVYFNTPGNSTQWWDKDVGNYKVFDSWKIVDWDKNSIYSDPKFNIDYTLADGSPIIKFVPSNTLFKDDLKGCLRPTGSKWSAGCLQYSNIAKPTKLSFGILQQN